MKIIYQQTIITDITSRPRAGHGRLNSHMYRKLKIGSIIVYIYVGKHLRLQYIGGGGEAGSERIISSKRRRRRSGGRVGGCG